MRLSLPISSSTDAVPAPPQISPFKVLEDLSEGKRVSLVCSVTSGTAPISFTWLKDGSPVGTLSGVKLVHFDDFQDQLQIESLDANHMGNYSCNAKNAYGSDRMSIQVVLKFSPKWKFEATSVSAVAGEALDINCEAIGYPQPIVKVSRGESERLESLKKLTVR